MNEQQYDEFLNFNNVEEATQAPSDAKGKDEAMMFESVNYLGDDIELDLPISLPEKEIIDDNILTEDILMGSDADAKHDFRNELKEVVPYGIPSTEVARNRIAQNLVETIYGKPTEENDSIYSISMPNISNTKEDPLLELKTINDKTIQLKQDDKIHVLPNMRYVVILEDTIKKQQSEMNKIRNAVQRVVEGQAREIGTLKSKLLHTETLIKKVITRLNKDGRT